MTRRYLVTTQIENGEPLHREITAPTATEAVRKGELAWEADGYTGFVFMQATNVENQHDGYRWPPAPAPPQRKLWT